MSNVFHYDSNITTKNSNNLKELKESYPLRSNVYSTTEFTFKFNSTKRYNESYTRCFAPSFAIHSPFELPLFFEFVGLEDAMIMTIEITPEIIKTDADLRKLSSHVRECYFEDERKLKFFKIYTQLNCKYDCLSIKYEEYCDCHVENGSEVCRNRDIKLCSFYYKELLENDKNFSLEKNCSCLPLCNSIRYHVKYFSEFSGENETVINIRMNPDDIILYRRHKQFTFSDIVSYVGGLLGLFAGISMLSIIEMFYFVTLRCGVNLWKRVRNNNVIFVQ